MLDQLYALTSEPTNPVIQSDGFAEPRRPAIRVFAALK